jgi:hypothetical protein
MKYIIVGKKTIKDSLVSQAGELLCECQYAKINKGI